MYNRPIVHLIHALLAALVLGLFLGYVLKRTIAAQPKLKQGIIKTTQFIHGYNSPN